MSELARYEAKDGVATITLDDATVNCYTYEMNRAVDESILKARFDTNVHVIVIRGAGEKFFCAGANINMLQKADPVFKYYFCLHANETLSRLEQTPKLTIAAINGHCVGGGLEYAMACDLRIARKGGGKIGLPEVSLGVLPGTGGTQRLARLVGKSKAIEIMTEGKNFEFEEAAQLGIVNKVFEGANADEFMRKVYDYARQFCPPHKASMAVGHIKRSVQSGLEIPLEYGLALERELQAKLFSSADAKIGLNAYVEKQKPQFTGK
ncbi:MAG TPA: enoyl-CoA hydratase/isomerase family protein [Planctomycetota bacterium]|nr:enoyl-CoA hydratase/isomerase family protein [Planctomycetota bacterium]